MGSLGKKVVNGVGVGRGPIADKSMKVEFLGRL